MGYYYTQSGQLVCDICGAVGARKYRCPWGYCPATAACPQCRKEHADWFGRPWHREHGCEKGHNEYAAEREEKRQLLANGAAVRCSALGNSTGPVHVLFRRGNGTCEGWYMSTETYHAIPLVGTNTTPDDYRKHGPLTPAPDDFGAGRTTKQVVLA